MDGNSTFRHSGTSVLSIVAIEAPVVVTSTELDEQLAPAYERLGARPGLLEGLAGIHERRWWPEGMNFADGAAMAGAKALAQSGIDPSQIGLMINSSVSRAYLEPSTAVGIHHKLGLPPSAMNFDLANACLGFVNSIHLAATMIDAALIVNGEDAQKVQENTIRRLNDSDSTTADFFSEFATLTLGSGAAAMVLGRSDLHSEGHRVIAHVVDPVRRVLLQQHLAERKRNLFSCVTRSDELIDQDGEQRAPPSRSAPLASARGSPAP